MINYSIQYILMTNTYFLNKLQQQGIVLHSVSDMAELEAMLYM